MLYQGMRQSRVAGGKLTTVLGLKAIIILPSPAVDTALDTIVEGDVVHGLASSHKKGRALRTGL